MKTIYEKKLRTSERFIMVYSIQKLKWLKENGFFYIFKCINENSGHPFFVFDVSYEIRECLREYNKFYPYSESGTENNNMEF